MSAAFHRKTKERHVDSAAPIGGNQPLNDPLLQIGNTASDRRSSRLSAKIAVSPWWCWRWSYWKDFLDGGAGYGSYSEA